MGLDMYLTAIVTNNEETNEKIGIEVGYWRKANQIHRWFVNNVQNGIDNCESYRVTLEHMKELKELCEKVRDNTDLASTLLPTASGFFFGTTEYDCWYFTDIQDTIDICEKVIPEMENNEYEVFYQSSW